MKLLNFILVAILFLCLCCQNPNPNVTQDGEDEFQHLKLDRQLNKKDKKFEDLIYVPIYSDIYFDIANQNLLLAATLSIRNTSFSDSLFVSTIDYYNTEGSLVKRYIDSPIVLMPMATINYVIEREDTSGGPGANFIIELSSDNSDAKPLVQAIMTGNSGNKGFAFSIDGYSVK